LRFALNDLSMTATMEARMVHPMKGPDDRSTLDENLTGNSVSDEHGIEADELANISGQFEFQVWCLRQQIELMWQSSSPRPTDEK
jgi:hypothetical protein